MMRVTAFSIEEDWISGISVIPVTYSKPYASTIPFFPSNMARYVASKGSKGSTQPYRTVPWVATFSGCCRQFLSRSATTAGNVDSWYFQLLSYVDLTNARGSPRIVSFPLAWLNAPADEATSTNPLPGITFCALSTAGPDGMVQRSGGTLNYPSDDNQTAHFVWSIATAPAGVAWDPLDAAAASNCRTLRVPNARAQFPTMDPNDPAFATTPFFGSLSVGCSIGDGCALGPCSYATADILLARAPAVDRGRLPILPTAPAAFSCTRATRGRLAAVRGLPLSSATAYVAGCLDLAYLYASSGDPLRTSLEVRYTAATAARQTPQLATAPGRISYAVTEAGQDHAALPGGARLSAPYGLQDIQVPPTLIPPPRHLAPTSSLAGPFPGGGRGGCSVCWGGGNRRGE
jgi:hypothetical protein